MNTHLDADQPDAVPSAAQPRLSRRALVGAGFAGTYLLAGAASAAPGRAKADTAVAVNLAGSAAPTSLSDTARALDKRLFPGFRQRFIETRGVEVEGRTAEGAVINVLVGGNGPPLMLIHGYPETHLCWHMIAGRLAERFTVVVPDLRGYGDSSKPGSSPDTSTIPRPPWAPTSCR